MTDTMDGYNVLSETQFVGTRLCVNITRVLFVGGSLPPWGAAGERSELSIKPPLGAPLLIFPRGYLMKPFPQLGTSAKQRGFEIMVSLSSVSRQRPSSHTCPFASNTAGNSVPTCGLRLLPSRLTPS